MDRLFALGMVPVVLAVVGKAQVDAAAQLWQFEAHEIARTCYAVDAVDSNVVFFYGVEQGSDRAAVFRSRNGGLTWEVFPWDGWAINDISATDSLHVWVVTSDRLYHSADGGRSWRAQCEGDTVTSFFDYVEMFDEARGVAVGDALPGRPLAVLSTDNGGEQWVLRNRSFCYDCSLVDAWRCVHFVSPLVAYGRFAPFGVSLDTFFVQKTCDGGSMWTPTPLGVGNVTVVRFFDEQIGIAASKGDLPLYLTTDGGASWRAQQLDLGDRWFQDLEFLPGDASTVFAALTPLDWRDPKEVLWLSNDTGKTWVPLPAPAIGCPRDLEMVTAAHGWVVGDWGVLRIKRGASNADPYRNPDIPGGFVLHPNWPNPFSSSTSIRVEVARAQLITGEVFDVCGRKVATLVEGQRLQPGLYGYGFSGRDLPSGVYVCRVRAGCVQASRRMLLLR